MADYLERARLLAEITELRKQQSEAHIRDIYVGLTADERVVRQRRDARIASLRLELAALDDGEPGLIRGAPRVGAPRSRER
jgi:hypothetical protein